VSKNHPVAENVQTIASLLSSGAVPMDEIEHRYGALLELVRRLIGVVPNCDPLLEIWPPAFRSYNLVVPNFLNLPAVLFGVGAPKEILGLAMYVSSRTAGCATVGRDGRSQRSCATTSRPPTRDSACP
jgi:hypothetical protein